MPDSLPSQRAISEGQSQLRSSPWMWLKLLLRLDLSQLLPLFNLALSKDVEKDALSEHSACQSSTQSLFSGKPSCSTFLDPLPPFSYHPLFLHVFTAKLKR